MTLEKLRDAREDDTQTVFFGPMGGPLDPGTFRRYRRLAKLPDGVHSTASGTPRRAGR